MQKELILDCLGFFLLLPVYFYIRKTENSELIEDGSGNKNT